MGLPQKIVEKNENLEFACMKNNNNNNNWNLLQRDGNIMGPELNFTKIYFSLVLVLIVKLKT